jgi:2,4'-dihydroxyacetophenone dioxygenase
MPLPTLAFPHDALMTLDMSDLPVYHDALPGVGVQPLFLDPHNGVWVLRVLFQPGVVLPAHYHTGTVHLWTLAGRWNYREYPDQPQTAGCYLFEPGSSIHTLEVPATNTGITEIVFIVNGSNVNFDDDGNYVGMLDANTLVQMIDQLVRERGLQPARYIRPRAAVYTGG